MPLHYTVNCFQQENDMKREIKSEQVMTRITPTLRKKLNRLALKLNMTPSAYISWLIERAK